MPLLSAAETNEADVQYTKDERMLDEFIRLHPMCSMDLCTAETLELLQSSNMRAQIAVEEIPVVPKSHDDIFLQPPNKAIGERECVCGENCLCVFMAKMRYGVDTKRGFVCKEFLLPKEHQRFLDGSGLPPDQRKCLVCNRYYTTYVYTLARTDLSFSLPDKVCLQSFCNARAPRGQGAEGPTLPTHAAMYKDAADMPTHCSEIGSESGYSPTAMLFVDEEFAQRRVARSTRMSAFQFHPIVRFSSLHYRYVQGEDGLWKIIQVGVSPEPPLTELGFRRPPSPMVRETAAGSTRPNNRTSAGSKAGS